MKYNPKLLSLALALALVVLGACSPGKVVVEEALFEAEASRQDLLERGVIRQVALPRGTIPRSAAERSPTRRSADERGVARGSERTAGVMQTGLVPAERVRRAPVLGRPVRLVSETSLAAGRFDPAPVVAAVLREANATRHEHGSGVLVQDAALTRAALAYARELADRREIEHLSPTPGRRTFRERIEAEGARMRVGGENLARLSSTAELLSDRVVRAWLRSPGHRVNLLDPIFSRTGIGVWLGGDGVWYVVQVYATES